MEGFEPLLQFAYTAKLLFTKENILDIHRCANILGFHNLDKACFDFLIPMFFNTSRSGPVTQRKVCCGRKSWPEKSPKASSSGDIDVDEEDDDDKEDTKVKEESGDTESLLEKQDPKMAAQCADVIPADETLKNPGCPDVTVTTDPALRCPKYRKFQNACGKERSCSPQVPSSCSSSSSSYSQTPVTKGQASVHHKPEGSGLARSVSGGYKSEADEAIGDEAVVVAVCPPPALVPFLGNPDGGGFRGMLDSSCSPSVGSAGAEPDCCPLGPCGSRFLDCAAGGEEEEQGCGGTNHQKSVDSDPLHPEISSVSGEKRRGDRSTIEREVAEHLAKGFWSAYLNPPKESPTGPSSGYSWCKRLALAPGVLDCPFLRDQEPSQAEKRSYDSSLNSGEDSDTEGASECSSSQRAPEVSVSLWAVPYQEGTLRWWLFVCIAPVCGWFH